MAPLPGGQFPKYLKCLPIEHDNNAGELDFEGGGYLKIEPDALTFDDIKDAVSLVIDNWIFDGGDDATIQEESPVLDYDDEDPGDRDIYAYGLHIVCNDSITSDRLITVFYSSQTLESYSGANGWVVNNPTNADWFDDLPPVYAELGTNNSDPEPETCEDQFWENDVSDRPGINNYHYNASWEMRSIPIDEFGHQACYDDDGQLIAAPATPWQDDDMETLAACGTADRVSPESQLFPTGHRDQDVRPFIRAAQLDGNPVEAEGIFGPTSLSHVLIRVGDNLENYIERRPPCTDETAQPDSCIKSPP